MTYRQSVHLLDNVQLVIESKIEKDDCSTTKCNDELTRVDTGRHYLARTFTASLLRSPACTNPVERLQCSIVLEQIDTLRRNLNHVRRIRIGRGSAGWTCPLYSTCDVSQS